MLEKILAIVGSVRFWILTLTAVVAILEQVTTGTATIEFVFNTVQVWLIAVAGLGTLDSVATRLGKGTTKTAPKKK